MVSQADGREATVTGNLLGVQPGESLRITGRWTRHPRHGNRFQAESFASIAPETLLGIERYLSSGLVRGIGKELASRLVRRFGKETLEVIDHDDGTRLREVEGIGPERARRILAAWKTQKGIRDVMVFLRSVGIGPAVAAKIYKRYGDSSRAELKADPYRIAAQIPGIGFRTADAIARGMGVAEDSPQRARAGALYALSQAAEEGHVFLPLEELEKACSEGLEIRQTACRAAVEDLAAKGFVTVEGEGPEAAVYERQLFEAEDDAARILADLLRAKAGSPAAGGGPLPTVPTATKDGLPLSDLQKEALRRAVGEKALVITGGPGTGKTTLLKGILDVFDALGLEVLLCAPTGRAAKRMEESTGRPGRTIHRLLEFNPRTGAFQRCAQKPLACDLLVADEASMIDTPLFRSLLAAMPAGARLILVGDADQLPSVGPGCVLRDVIRSGAVPVAGLTEIFRQAAESMIVVNSHRIHDGQMPAAAEGRREDFFFIEREDPEQALATLKEIVLHRIPRSFGLDPVKDVQVLTPMRKGLLGTINLNAELQALLNPEGPSLSHGAVLFRRGDRVMQVRNDYDREVFNGDVGTVSAVDPEERRLSVSFDGRTVEYPWEDLDGIRPSYACSIHKAQGSEFPAVVIPLHTQHYVLLTRNLLYTAVTRGRRLVAIVGSRKALSLAVHDRTARARHTLLAERIASYARPPQGAPS